MTGARPGKALGGRVRPSRRLLGNLAVLAVVVGLVFLPRPGPARPAGSRTAEGAGSSSSWFCVVPLRPTLTVAGLGLTVTDLAPTPTTAVVAGSVLHGRVRSDVLHLVAGETATVPVSSVARRSPSGLTVRADTTDLAVDLVAGGRVLESCARRAGASWFLPAGATTAGQDMLIAVYDPLATDAVVSLRFLTDNGVVSPPDDQGIVVDGGGLVLVDAGLQVLDRADVTAVVTARRGAVVAAEALVNGRAATVALGAGVTARELAVAGVPAGFSESVTTGTSGGSAVDVAVKGHPSGSPSGGSPSGASSGGSSSGGSGASGTTSADRLAYVVVDPGHRSAVVTLRLFGQGGVAGVVPVTVPAGAVRVVTVGAGTASGLAPNGIVAAEASSTQPIALLEVDRPGGTVATRSGSSTTSASSTNLPTALEAAVGGPARRLRLGSFPWPASGASPMLVVLDPTGWRARVRLSLAASRPGWPRTLALSVPAASAEVVAMSGHLPAGPVGVAIRSSRPVVVGLSEVAPTGGEVTLEAVPAGAPPGL
jgi:uncharacterized membrane protein YgcG